MASSIAFAYGGNSFVYPALEVLCTVVKLSI